MPRLTLDLLSDCWLEYGRDEGFMGKRECVAISRTPVAKRYLRTDLRREK